MDLPVESTVVIDIISEHDEMFAGDRAHYFSVGQSALSLIDTTLKIVGRESCELILDLPCGHGRVMRHLRAAFPAAGITACDLNEDGLRFCEQTFGATPVPSRPHVEDIPLSQHFDLIWCGSLLTHLDEERWSPTLSFFAEHLTIGGAMIFTTHGRRSAQWIRDGKMTYGIEPDRLPPMLSAYESCGFAFAPYREGADYGITISAAAWVLPLIQQHSNLRVVMFNEAGWDDHQDVYACVRTADRF